MAVYESFLLFIITDQVRSWSIDLEWFQIPEIDVDGIKTLFVNPDGY
jgi:hypothetical protein